MIWEIKITFDLSSIWKVLTVFVSHSLLRCMSTSCVTSGWKHLRCVTDQIVAPIRADTLHVKSELTFLFNVRSFNQ